MLHSQVRINISQPDPDSKTKIIHSRKLVQYGDMVGLRYH